MNINEMAKEYIKSTLVGSSYIKECAYKQGAKDVVDLIEKCFDPSHDVVEQLADVKLVISKLIT
jgi:hypothetical protein